VRLDQKVSLAVVVALFAPSAHAEYGPVPFNPDAAFGSGGVSRAVLPPEVSPRRMFVAEDGAMYTLSAAAAPGELTYYVTRRDALGALDAGFGDAGVMVHSDATVAGEQLYVGLCTDPSSGAVFLVGATEGEFAFIVRRFLADGAPDTGWGTDGLLTVPMAGEPAPYAQGCAVQADGKLVVVGSWSALDADALGLVNRAFVARLTTAGALDPGFADAGVKSVRPLLNEAVQYHHALTHVDITGDGSIYLAGLSTDPRGPARDLLMAKLTAAGDPALPYGNAGTLRKILGSEDAQVLSARAGGGPGVLAVGVNLGGNVDTSYGCAGLKAGPVQLEALAPLAGAFDNTGAALFAGRETAAGEYESVVRTTGLPELGATPSNGEEVAHGCPPTDVLPHKMGASNGLLLAAFALGALLRRLRRR
jgi:uncharacterized delta-60 repeat protein